MGHVLRLVDVAQVHHHRVAQERAHAVGVQRRGLAPCGSDLPAEGRGGSPIDLAGPGRVGEAATKVRPDRGHHRRLAAMPGPPECTNLVGAPAVRLMSGLGLSVPEARACDDGPFCAPAGPITHAADEVWPAKTEVGGTVGPELRRPGLRCHLPSAGSATGCPTRLGA